MTGVSTIGYVVRGLPATYGSLYRAVNRVTLGVVPLFGGFLVFWLVPGVPVFDTVRSLRRGDVPAPVSRSRLAVLWLFALVVVAWSGWRRLAG